MTVTLQKINKVDGEKILGSDITKIDSNSIAIENAINNLPISSGSTVTTSTTNGNIKIDGAETTVYTAPTYTKTDVGLGNVDNTSDVNKPISTSTQTALNGKANSSHTHTKSQIIDFPVVPVIVALTVSEYSAIAVPDVNTLYLIKV
jgi:hypothetical protein